MTPNQLVDQAKAKLAEAVEHYKSELNKIRSGRAHPSMLDGIMVEAYGSPTPLVQVGSVTVPESQQLQITPYDPANLQAICTAIRNDQSLGLNPADDGRVVRVPIPPLTEERRKQIVKILGDKTEDCMIRTRNVRHDILKDGEQAKKDKDMSDDDYTRLQKQVDELMASTKTEVEQLHKAKEQEIMTV